MSLDDPLSNLHSFDSFIAVSCGALLSGYSVTDLSERFSVDTGRPITTFVHPLSYRNKFLVGHDDFTFSLWNVASGLRIYNFVGFGSRVREFVQSPRPDVFAVALSDGRLVMHDVKADYIFFPTNPNYVAC
jgi:U3 small nucleolar RNA-associated protein 21